MQSLLNRFAEDLRAADVMDMLLVAAVFFVVITWVRSTQSGSAARRLMALVILYALAYLAAEYLALYLVQRVLGILFFVMLIALVVVFQGEIRHLLDRFGSFGLRREQTAPAFHTPVNLLAETAARLAEDRIGALIAIRGARPWESVIQGGVWLDARLSQALLHSIFDPGSPGHDGALLVEGDRATRFAVHLPLASVRPEGAPSWGTRHAAALGLATETDAFVIVVSEERGTIGVAQDGDFTTIESIDQLEERLERFWTHHYRPDEADAGHRWFSRRNLETAALSLTLAAIIWFLAVFGADTVVRTYGVPVEIRNLPPEWGLEESYVPSVLITLSGSAPEFDRLEPTRLVVAFDLSDPQPGINELVISEENLSPLPAGLDLIASDPATIQVNAARQRRHTVPVRILLTAPVPPGFALTVDPPSIDVLVPADTPAPDYVPTERIPLERLEDSDVVEAQLEVPANVRPVPGEPSAVRLRLQRQSTAPP